MLVRKRILRIFVISHLAFWQCILGLGYIRRNERITVVVIVRLLAVVCLTITWIICWVVV